MEITNDLRYSKRKEPMAQFSPHIDRQAFSVLSIKEQDLLDASYWRDKTPHQRLEALEQTRRILYGEHSTTGRLQRVFEITQRP